MSSSTLGLSEPLQAYLLEVSLQEPELCRQLRGQTLSMPEARMLSSPEQVQLLLMLLRMLRATNGLEIGTFTGYTSLRLTLGIPALRLTCCDVNEEYTAVARSYWERAGVAERIDLQLGPALETLDRLRERHGQDAFDFAYIDADKTAYQAYVERCLALVRPGGLIAIDNTLWSGAVADPDDDGEDTVALRRLNRWLHQSRDRGYDLSLVPIGDGLTLLRLHDFVADT